MAKQALKKLLVQARLDALIQPFHGGVGSVLNFHRVRSRDPDLMFEMNHQNSVEPEQFCGLLDSLAKANIDIIDLDEALTRLKSKNPRRFACLTFDDGYLDNHDTLLPIARCRRVCFTIYVTPGLIDGTAPLWWYGLDLVIARERRVRLHLEAEIEIAAATHAEKEAAFAAVARFLLRAGPADATRVTRALADRYGVDFKALTAKHMMSWEMVRALAASPFVTIGAHSVSHPNLSLLDEGAARHEMAESRTRLAAETKQHVRHFAYPYGTMEAVGVREVRLASEVGFRTAVTTNPGNLFPDHVHHAQVWPRHGIGPADGPEALRLKLAGVASFFRTPFGPVVIAPEAHAGS